MKKYAFEYCSICNINFVPEENKIRITSILNGSELTSKHSEDDFFSAEYSLFYHINCFRSVAGDEYIPDGSRF